MGMKILITGGAGFVGANLAVYFAEKGHTVISMDNLVRRGAELSLPRLKSHGVQFFHGDVRRKEDFKLLPNDIDFILNTASQPSAIDGYKNPEFDLYNNSLSVINVLEFAKAIKAGVIQWSTNKVYCGDKLNAIPTTEKETRYEFSDKNYKHGIDENFSIDGGDHSIYGLSKVMADLMCQEYARAFGLKTVINRFSCLCGPYQWGKSAQGWYAWWVIAFHFKLPLTYIGWKGKQVRDVLYINDIARLIELEMENIYKISGQVFNVGGGPKFNISLIEATSYLEKKFGHSLPIQVLKEVRKADQVIYISDIRKIKETLGWEPVVGPEEAFDRIIEWVKKDEAKLRNLYVD